MPDNPVGRGAFTSVRPSDGQNPLARGPGPPGPFVRTRTARSNRVIPNARIDPTGQLSPAQQNAGAQSSTPAVNQLLVASLDSLIPILYGGPERIGGKLYVVKQTTSGLIVSIILSEGQIEQIGDVPGNTFEGVFINDVDQTGNPSLVIRKYLGTAGQAADAGLVAAITSPVAYTETLANTAYVVLEVPTQLVFGPTLQGIPAGFPRAVFNVKGLKLFDPRSNLLPNSNALTVWTPGGTQTLGQNADGPWSATNYAWTLNDTDASAAAFRTTAFTTVSSANTYAWAVKVKKTTGGTSKTVRVDVGFANGAPVSSVVYLNTDTGVTSGGTGVTSTLINSAFWLVEGTITDNASGNTAFGMALYPAVNNNGVLGATLVATTGSAIFCEAGVRRSTRPRGYIATAAVGIDQQTVWSDNSALALGDFMASTVYGEGRVVDAQSLAYAAEYCDEMLGVAGQANEKRSRITLRIDGRRGVREWRDILRSYVPCWTPINAGVCYLRLDRDEPTDHTFASANIRPSPLPVISRAGIGDTPTTVVVSYTDTSVTPFKTQTIDVNPSANPRRVTRIDMPGIRSRSQAKRAGLLRLNHHTLEDTTGRVPVFETGLKVLDGDLAEFTDDVGLTSQKCRVLAAEDEGHGRWTIAFRTFSASAYSNLVEATPSSPAMNPANPNAPPVITGLSLVEDRRFESGVWVSRIRATWDPVDSTFPYVKGYIVELFDVATNATYTWVAGVIEVSSPVHGLALNDPLFLDFTSGGATIDGGFSVTNVPNANTFRTGYAGSGAAGNVTWRRMREHEIVTASQWLSQPVVLGVQYSVRVRVYSISGVVGP